MTLRNEICLWMFFGVATIALAAVETEQELRSIEKAHAAISEIEADFRVALKNTENKKDLLKALSSCRIKDVKSAEIKVGRTSHRLRNPEKNAPPEWTKPYLHKFSKSKRSEIPEYVLTKISNHHYGYLQPIFVEPICLNCHGRSVEPEVQKAIRRVYPKDQALNFNLGDFRGVLWLEMKEP